jgi:tetratricopeptide (TPR) repeat protein
MALDRMQPKWGGSYEQMDAFVKSSRSYYAKNPKLKTLEGYLAYHKGDNEYFFEKNHKKALQYFNEALQYEDLKKNANLHLFKANAMSDLGPSKDDNLEIIEECNIALGLDPQNKWGLVTRAWGYYRIPSYSEARADLATVIKIDTGLSGAHVLLAYINYDQNNIDEAIKEMEIVVKLEPKDTAFQKILQDYYSERDKKKFVFRKPGLGEKETSAFWNTNLLANPSAENGTKDWELWGKGGTIKSNAVERGNIFYTMDVTGTESHFYQDVLVSLDGVDAYLAAAGYLSTDEDLAGSSAKRPSIEGCFMRDRTQVISNFSGTTMFVCKSVCWKAIWGIYKMPATTGRIRIFLDHQPLNNTPSASRFYYDDLELRVFKTSREAEEFIDSYKKKHPEILSKTSP